MDNEATARRMFAGYRGRSLYRWLRIVCANLQLPEITLRSNSPDMTALRRDLATAEASSSLLHLVLPRGNVVDCTTTWDRRARI
jgi:hypothetical protein